jgi:hypothetical protein
MVDWLQIGWITPVAVPYSAGRTNLRLGIPGSGKPLKNWASAWPTTLLTEL